MSEEKKEEKKELTPEELEQISGGELHPFYTGRLKLIDPHGRIEKLKKKHPELFR